MLKISTKTQICLALAAIGPVLVLTVGEYLISGIEFAPPLAPLTAVVQDALSHRYIEAAVTIFLGSLGAAAACFEKCRRRIFEGR